MTTLREEVADGFVLCAGAAALRKQAHICEEHNKPFWLQLVGTGITTAWAAHWGAVLAQARWPAITCMNIWESQLLETPLAVQGGFLRVPEESGLGVTVDEEALARYQVDYSFVKPPRHLYQYSRANGPTRLYACTKEELQWAYPGDAQPVCEAGSSLTVVADDGSDDFATLYGAVKNGQTYTPGKITTFTQFHNVLSPKRG
jgi:hypothetical protein